MAKFKKKVASPAEELFAEKAVGILRFDREKVKTNEKKTKKSAKTDTSLISITLISSPFLSSNAVTAILAISFEIIFTSF